MIQRFAPFVWKSAWRKKRRAILTMLAVAVAVFVHCALDGAIEGMRFPLREVSDAQAINVREARRAKVLASRLPETYTDRVAGVDGVALATGVVNELAIVGEEGVHVFVRGIVPDDYRRIHPFDVNEQAYKQFADNPRGALVGYRLREQMGWSVGSEIELAKLGLRATLLGEIPKQDNDLGGYLLVHKRGMQAARGLEGQISYVLALPEQGQAVSAVAAAIDRLFEFAPVPTLSGPARGYAEALVEQFAALLEYLRMVGLVAAAMVAVAAASALAMSVRERTREIGTLKAIGFPPALVLKVVLVESFVLSLIGGLLGMGLAVLVLGTSEANMTGVTPSTLATALGLAAAIGLLGGLGPALRAARLNPLAAMRTLG